MGQQGGVFAPSIVNIAVATFPHEHLLGAQLQLHGFSRGTCEEAPLRLVRSQNNRESEGDWVFGGMGLITNM